MLKSILILTAFAIVLSACDENPVLPLSYEEDNIREAVFRHHFADNGSGYANPGYGPDTSIHFFFLAFAFMDTGNYHRIVSRWDPPEAFMNRFIDNIPPVRKHSQAKRDSFGRGVFDITTGLRGLRFEVGQIRYLSTTEVEVEAAYYAGGLNAEGDVFYLRKSNNRWWVTRRIYIWVS